MHERLLPWSLVVLILILTAAACAPPPVTSPTSSRSLPTDTPTTEATDTVPAASPTPTPPPATALPTSTAGPPSDRTIALFSVGSPERAGLHALKGDGSTTELNRVVSPQAAVSDDGRWVATSRGHPSANGVVAFNLKTGATYTVPVASDLSPYGMAFDSGGNRLAFLELGLPGANGTPWALIVLTMEDSSAVRFEAVTGPDDSLLPGAPIGWAGDELLLNTFIPYSEAGSEGLWAVTLPPDVTSAPVDALDRRRVLSGDDYLFEPELSPGGARVLYLSRDCDYTPDDYEPVGYDLAVNEVRVLDLASGSSRLLVEETEGGALGGDVAWSPDGALGLFAEGHYEGNTFGSLTMKTVDDQGAVTEVAPIPLPPEGFLISLDWCSQDIVLVVVATSDGVHQLYALDISTRQSPLVASDDDIAVLGCVHREGGAGANADVTHVRAVESPDGTWTFYVTVEHPDTGWEDYADGWDVVTPEGEVLKPDPESEFTRTLLHPHVDEQPFTRSQSGIVIPEDVTEVRVRAHDIVDGYGGEEVVVDLTKSSGPDFEVERE